jgi:hypothetical protein
MHSLEKLISDPWFWVTVGFSVFGALVVYLGLKVGTDAEKLLPPPDFKKDIFGDIVKPYKAKMDFGHKIVMAGVAIEAVCALAVCVISGLENADLKEKAEEIRSSNLVLQTNVASLNGAVIQLAHLYDLSTNALDEANERVANAESNSAVLAKEVLVQSQQIQQAAKTANETRDFVSESNTIARINEEKAAVVEVGDVMADVRSVVKNSNLAEISQLKQRELTIEQITTFTNALIGVPRGSITVYFTGELESERFAEQISNLLKEIGYNIEQPPSHMMIIGSLKTGLWIDIPKNNEPIFAAPIQRAFKAINFDAKGEYGPASLGGLSIIVGEKE